MTLRLGPLSFGHDNLYVVLLLVHDMAILLRRLSPEVNVQRPYTCSHLIPVMSRSGESHREHEHAVPVGSVVVLELGEGSCSKSYLPLLSTSDEAMRLSMRFQTAFSAIPVSRYLEATIPFELEYGADA